MNIHFSRGIENAIKGKYIFLDTDFLNVLFHNTDVLKQITNLTTDSFLHIDELTQFELLRGVFEPKKVQMLTDFMENDSFIPIHFHQTQFQQIKNNAITLSRIFSMKAKSKTSSLADLYLAGRVMMNPHQNVILTGNKKDFPSCVFDTTGVISAESNGDTIQSFCVMQFSTTKFTEALSRLQALS